MSEHEAFTLRLKRNAISFFGLAIIAIAVCIFVLQKWQDSVTESSPSKPICAWIEKDYTAAKAPTVVIFGDSQLGGLRSADAKVAKRKLDFVLDHHGYSIENELQVINHSAAPSRLDISNALSRLGFANTLSAGDRPSEYNEGGLLRSPKVFIACQPGSIVSDYYAMSKGLISEKKKPAVAIITVNPRSFLDNGLSCAGDSDYFRFFARRSTLDNEIFNTAYPSLQSKFNFAMKNTFRAPIAQVAVGQFVFLPDDQQHFRDNLIYPQNFSLHADTCRHQIWFLNETLKYYNALKIKPIVVSLPLLFRNDSIAKLKTLHDELKSPICDTCKSQNAKYFDLTTDTRFDESDFLDPVHLSQNGGAKIAKILSEYIAKIDSDQ